jgi:MFS family permease
MSFKEWRTVAALAVLFSFRMLGLFMILPVFSTFASTLPGSTATLIGLALGIYGLTQAALQMPLGLLSDKIGRKPVIAMGLVVFAVGSVVAALAHSLPGIILGRALQGAGAIGSTLMATVADLTPTNSRARAMALVGGSIGLSFALAMVLGPIINHWLGLAGIFWLTAGLALFGLGVLYSFVPTPAIIKPINEMSVWQALGLIIKQVPLLKLNFAILAQHAILTACFIVVPLRLQALGSFDHNSVWMFYLPILAVSFILMVPIIIISEKKQCLKLTMRLAISLTLLAQLLLGLGEQTLWQFALVLGLYFINFNLLEALLPSQVSKIAPAEYRGTALGVYSSAQFLGIFLGGSVGGLLFGHFQAPGVFIGTAALSVVWLLLSW